MQLLALRHLVVFVVALLIIIVRFLQQRRQNRKRTHERGTGLFQGRVVRLRPVRIRNRTVAIGRIVKRVNAIDDLFIARGPGLGGPAQIAGPRLERASGKPVEALDIGLHFFRKRWRLAAFGPRDPRHPEGRCQTEARHR